MSNQMFFLCWFYSYTYLRFTSDRYKKHDLHCRCVFWKAMELDSSANLSKSRGSGYWSDEGCHVV